MVDTFTVAPHLVHLVQVNDVHTTDRPPINRTDSYLDDLFAKLEGCLLADPQPDAVLITGDLFHNPAASRNSHYLVGRWLELIGRAYCPFIAIPGNHDLASGRLDSLDRQPLGSLAHHPNFVLLHSGAVTTVKGLRIGGIHWTPSVEALRPFLPSEPVDVLMVHAPIAQDRLPGTEWLNPFEVEWPARIVCFGHVHKPEGIFKVGETYFANPGALARASLSADDFLRMPKVTEIEFRNGRFERAEYKYALRARPASEIYRVAEAVLERQDRVVGEEFARVLQDVTVNRVYVEDLVTEAVRLAGDDTKAAELAREILMKVAA